MSQLSGRPGEHSPALTRTSRPQRLRNGAIGVVCTGVACATFLSACGNPVAKLTTAETVGHALAADSAQPGMSATFSITDAAALTTMHGGPTAAQARLLAGASITFAVHTNSGETLTAARSGTSPKGGDTEAVDITAHLAGGSPVELRVVDGVLYTRAQAAALFADFGAKPGESRLFSAELAGLNVRIPGLSALSAGRWVSVKTSALESLLPAKTFNRMPKSTAGESTQVLSALHMALSHTAEFANLGDHAGRTEYQVTVDERQFVTEFAQALPVNLRGLDPSGAAALRKAAGKLDRQVTVDVWTEDNRAEEIDVPLAQFSPKVPAGVDLRVILAPSAPITTPAGATTLNLGPYLKAMRATSKI